ncbi:flagellar hook-length control protein FliK [Amphritea opalescens]|uniref:Flagellar hook-length control protein FliK n=1 Tax=Amphritea opalescens TaxID=2490544 RepID=A0A430KTF4_9GAMM|nr:flagellar hook-length control protein FliK [Amphritea opalescens]RTE66825.1 flagellar hook-length control protein FliK [Amphritea opalescens]
MLNPLSIQNLQSSAGKSLSATELVRALPLNTPTQINVRQSSADASRPNQFNLQVQLGSQLYQLKSDQSLPSGSTATLTRTAAGQLLLSSTPNQSPAAQPNTLGTPATNNQNTAANQPLIPLKTSTQTSAGTTATIPASAATQINSLLPLNRPVLATLTVAVRTGASEGNLLATINGRSVPLSLNQALPFDGKVVLTRTSDQQVQIQPLPASTQNQNLNNTINDALRYVLPTQQPVAGSLLKLQQLNNKTGGEKSPVNSAISSILSLFGVKTSSAADAQTGVKQNLLNGGLFTESNLANPGKLITSNEMKYQLNQLLQQADKLPEQARQQLQDIVKGLLNRVTSNQLESLQNTRTNNDGVERFFTLDLPVKNGEQLDNVELKISEHRRQLSEDEWQHSWRVRLHFDLEQQGTIDAELVLEDEHQITAHFWCSQAEVAEELNDKLPEFNQQLHQQGFSIQSTHCSEGAAPKAINRIEPLIDVTT